MVMSLWPRFLAHPIYERVSCDNLYKVRVAGSRAANKIKTMTIKSGSLLKLPAAKLPSAEKLFLLIDCTFCGLIIIIIRLRAFA